MIASLLPGPTPPRDRWKLLLDTLRGLLAVTLLLAGAVDALVAACLGTRPIGPRLRKLRGVIDDSYRLGRANAYEADVVDDQDVK
jgi:hypothetical protein